MIKEMLTLTLVRHATTATNAERRYPHPNEDAPLSDKGEKQADQLPPLLPRNPDQIYTSPHRRAQQTASRAGYDAKFEPALAEARFGVMSGKTWAELEEVYSDMPWHWIKAIRDPSLDFGPPQGETGKEFHQRISDWLQALPKEGHVLAFTHAGTIQAILRLTVGLEAVETPPCSIITLKRAGSWWLTRLIPLDFATQQDTQP